MNRAVRQAHASAPAKWVLRRMPSGYLARLWGVSEGRARHLRSDSVSSTSLSDVLTMVADPRSDGPAVAEAVLEQLERRYLEEARHDRAALEAQLARLMDALPDVEARARRAMMRGGPLNDALRDLSRATIEIIAVRSALGLEEE